MMKHLLLTLLGIAALAAPLHAQTYGQNPPQAADAYPGGQNQLLTEQMKAVNRAVNTVERLRSEPQMKQNIQPLLAQARAVLVIPDLVKGGFIFGAEYGTGVLLSRDQATGRWSGPAFYSIASGSLGLQIGIQDAEAIFIIMSDGGLQAVMSNKFKAGANAGVAVIAVGAGTQAATTSHGGADIYAFSKAVGLYGGVSLEGSGILPRHEWNAAYYGGAPAPEDIVLARRLDSPQANRLRDVLMP